MFYPLNYGDGEILDNGSQGRLGKAEIGGGTNYLSLVMRLYCVTFEYSASHSAAIRLQSAKVRLGIPITLYICTSVPFGRRFKVLRDAFTKFVHYTNVVIGRKISFLGSLSVIPLALGNHWKEAGSLLSRLPPMSVTEYITARRIEAAKNRLVLKDEKIMDVALACGFSSSTYFSIIFKKHTGRTPLDYRNERNWF